MRGNVFSFASFYAGKILAVVALCVAAAWLGGIVVDDAGRVFGFNVPVQVLMFGLAVFLIVRWFGKKNMHCEQKTRKLPLFVCGAISGAAPCAPLIMALGYASTLSVANAAVIGIVFSVASSLLPLAVLCILTGLLSGAMFREIPGKIWYFQLAAYVLIAATSGFQILAR
jgi:hypothetical protein